MRNQDARRLFTSFNGILKHQTEIINAARAEVGETKAKQQLLIVSPDVNFTAVESGVLADFARSLCSMTVISGRSRHGSIAG